MLFIICCTNILRTSRLNSPRVYLAGRFLEEGPGNLIGLSEEINYGLSILCTSGVLGFWRNQGGAGAARAALTRLQSRHRLAAGRLLGNARKLGWLLG